MNQKKSFKEATPLDKRVRLNKMIKDQYPEKLPVILESNTIDLTQNKYLVPGDITVTKFLIEIRRHMPSISSETAYYLITSKNIVLSPTEEMSLAYAKHQEDCGFLYLHVEKENTYG